MRIAYLAFALLAWITVCFVSSEGLSDRQKLKLVDAIGKRLENKAFAFETDFSTWYERADARREEILAAETKEELEAILADALDEYGLSHLGIFAPSTAKLRRQGMRAGIGVTIHPQEQGGGLISYVLTGSPAERAGLLIGDVITLIDGVPFEELEQLRGLEGDRKSLTWERSGRTLSSEVVYSAFTLAEPSSMRWIEEDVALIRIQSFQYRFYNLGRINKFFKEAKDAEAIIIDLRNNRGGLSSYSRHLASKISSQSEPFALLANKRRDRSDAKTIHPLAFSRPYRGQVIVLTDSLSASAADLLPAFISETGRGLVIGQRTSGALQLARTFTLPYGFRLYLPVAELLSPQGNRIEAVGFPPDIELTLEETIDDDRILNVALEQIHGAQTSSPE